MWLIWWSSFLVKMEMANEEPQKLQPQSYYPASKIPFPGHKLRSVCWLLSVSASCTLGRTQWQDSNKRGCHWVCEWPTNQKHFCQHLGGFPGGGGWLRGRGLAALTSARNVDTSCVRHLKIIRTAGSALDGLPTLHSTHPEKR